ncbi:MAG: hypothetical protein IJI50_00555 [Ruminococcus sp.]|nr:hypothetical protein [Ruminococcus sp.]
MFRSIPLKLISCLLALSIMFTASIVTVNAADNNNGGKYVKDVFIAYGEDKETADKWLQEHNWESIADLNEGKTSEAWGYHNAVAVLGIQRTDDPDEAITDMAIMNMTGGYSFDKYDDLVEEKKAQITEFINTFIPAMEEYRKNYNGQGSEGGKKRAQTTHDLLNKFYDGDPNGEYAINDTGKPLGDLLLNKTKTEIGDDAYNALSAEEKLNTADFQQIILESSGPALLIVKQALALATDTAETSWLDRLSGLSGSNLVDHIEEFAPEAAGQDLAPSAAKSLLAAHFEDYSKVLASQWSGIREKIRWYEDYCNEYELWSETDDPGLNDEKVKEHFDALKEKDESHYKDELNRLIDTSTYYDKLSDVSYAGKWGETLYDFFNPEDEEADYSKKYDDFAPLAAALSPGQRAGLEFLSLKTLLKVGVDSESVMESEFPSVEKALTDKKGNTLESISIYSGINRAIFRNGVALTSNAEMQKSLGNNPYNDLWDEKGIVNIVFYCTTFVGLITAIAGAWKYIEATKYEYYRELTMTAPEADVSDAASLVDSADTFQEGVLEENMKTFGRDAETTKAVNVSKWIAGIGGAIMILAAAVKGVQLYKQYHRDFTPIPRMIVDEKDIVTYTTDEKGNQIENINFDSFAYYEIAKCNRQEVGVHTNAQYGVEDYAEWGCGDYADINADVGKEWLALYVNRAGEKGKPILASTFVIQKGKEGSEAPANHDGSLHMFTYTSPMQLDDTAYCYRNANDGLYLFWQTDATAYAPATASAFGGGTLALAGIGGLALGILGTTLVMLPKRKKKEEETAE